MVEKPDLSPLAAISERVDFVTAEPFPVVSILPNIVEWSERNESVVGPSSAIAPVKVRPQDIFLEIQARKVDSAIRIVPQAPLVRSQALVEERVDFVVAESFLVASALPNTVVLSERNESVVGPSLAIAPVKVRSQDTPSDKTSPTETPAKPTDSIWTIGIIAKKAQEDLAASSSVGIKPPPEHVTLAWSILHFFQRGPPMPCGQWVNVPILLKHAEQALGLNIKYNKEQFSLLDLHNFSAADYRLNDEALARGESLEDIIEKQLIPRRMHGATVATIREVFKDDPGIEATITLLAEGQQPFMKPQFKPNGGKENIETSTGERAEE